MGKFVLPSSRLSFSPIPLDLSLSLSPLSHILWSSKQFLLLPHTPQLLFLLFLRFHRHKKTNFAYFSFFAELNCELDLRSGFSFGLRGKIERLGDIAFCLICSSETRNKERRTRCSKINSRRFFLSSDFKITPFLCIICYGALNWPGTWIFE